MSNGLQKSYRSKVVIKKKKFIFPTSLLQITTKFSLKTMVDNDEDLLKSDSYLSLSSFIKIVGHFCMSQYILVGLRC